MRKVKSAPPPAADVREFVMSDDSVDRMGDVIEQSGWDLSSFTAGSKFNPIALFNHKPDQVVGSWADVRVDGNQMIGRFVPAESGTSEIADSVRKLIDQNILRATSVGFEPVEKEPLHEKAHPQYGPFRFKRMTLLECSIVSVPANPNAVAIARSLGVSHETISRVFDPRVFGEHAETRRRDLTAIGEQAVSILPIERSRTMNAPIPISQRIEHVQHELNFKRDGLNKLDEATDYDYEAANKFNEDIGQLEQALATLKTAEARQGLAAASTAMTAYTGPIINATAIQSSTSPAAPAVLRRPIGHKEISGLDLLVRQGVVKLLAHREHKPPELVMREIYPESEMALRTLAEYVEKAATAPAKTTVTGWAAELVQQINAPFQPSLQPDSVYGPLSAKGLKLTFGSNGIINVPTRAATPSIAGSFVGEGAPIPVRQAAFTTTPLTPKKMAVITTWTREISDHSVPAIEGLLKDAILSDTSISVDTVLLDASPATTIRPAGLRNGVAGQTATAGGGFNALIGDLKNLTGAILTATNGNIRNMVFIMNPAQALSIGFIQPAVPGALFPFQASIENNMLVGYPVIKSGTVPLGTVVCLDAADYVSVTGDTPRFEISDQATLHMEDSSPQHIGTTGTPAVVAAPVMSMWQTDSMALRLILPMNWAVRRAGVVSWVAGVTW